MAKSLTGPKKAAILVLSLGEDAAGEVLKNLSDDEIRLLTQHIQRVQDIDPLEVDRVANEYFRVAERKRIIPAPPETKMNYLKKILGKGLGEERSEQLLGGMLEVKGKTSLEKLKWHSPHTIADFLSEEHPQIIAVILANMGDPQMTQAVLEELPGPLHADVLARLIHLREIPDDLLNEIEESLSEQVFQTRALSEEDGTRRVAGVINSSTENVERLVMGHIEEKNPGLAQAIRDEMFPFEDFIKVDNVGLQKVMEEASGEDLILALRTASEPLRQHFFQNISNQSAKEIKEAVAKFGPVRISEIEAAQKRLSNIARDLSNKGLLHLLDKKK